MAACVHNGLIENGHLYIAQPPLYRLESKKNGVQYVCTDADKDVALKPLGSDEVPLRNRFSRRIRRK